MSAAAATKRIQIHGVVVSGIWAIKIYQHEVIESRVRYHHEGGFKSAWHVIKHAWHQCNTVCGRHVVHFWSHLGCARGCVEKHTNPIVTSPKMNLRDVREVDSNSMAIRDPIRVLSFLSPSPLAVLRQCSLAKLVRSTCMYCSTSSTKPRSATYAYPLAIGRHTRPFIQPTTQQRHNRSRVGTTHNPDDAF
jgi:hypothetical protein